MADSYSVGRGLALALIFTLVSTSCSHGGPDDEEVRVAQAELDLGGEAFRRGEYREALVHVEKSLEVDDQNADVHYLGAMALLVFCAEDESSPDCRYPEAERHIRAALEVAPDFRDAKNALGVVLVHSKRPKEAIAVLEPLTRDILYRSPEKAWGNLGWAYLEAGRVDDAVQALKRSVAAQPLFCVGHYRLGLAYEKRRDYAAARQSLTHALEVSEGGCERLQPALLARARVNRRLGMHALVRTDLERCRGLAVTTDAGRQCARQLGGLH